MANIFCLGYFTTQIQPINLIQSSSTTLTQDAILHRGRRNIHVMCSSSQVVGDLNERDSMFLGPLIGKVGSVSRPITQSILQDQTYKQDIIYLRVFYVEVSRQPTASCIYCYVFCHGSMTEVTTRALSEANLKLEMIPDYQPSAFFSIQQLPINDPTSIESNTFLTKQQFSVDGCMTNLMSHQVKAIKFMIQSESSGGQILYELWKHRDNDWLRRVFDEGVKGGHISPEINFESKGCMLGDDMGLGKTLSTLAMIQLTKSSALDFLNSASHHEGLQKSSATLVICPLSTLDNWKNEIETHFAKASLPFTLFHGEQKYQISYSQLQRIAIVLATYEAICYSCRQDTTRSKRSYVNLRKVEWFRIVLDEAHYMKDPQTTRSEILMELEADRRICLTGTPLQNKLQDLHSLIKFIRLEPWCDEHFWKKCIECRVGMCDQRAIATLQRLMSTISMRRLKTTILELPEKHEKVVEIELKSPWHQAYRTRHEFFAMQFGKNRIKGEGWNSGDFFRSLMDLRQLCNHPALIDRESGRGLYGWDESSKIVHLMGDLKDFLKISNDGRVAKAVVFSEFQRFLEIIAIALRENNIGWTTMNGDLEQAIRVQNLKEFRSNPGCQVLLATIRSAGVGIDLRCAQKVYIMEPCWNPAIEEQAIDRLYRIGQSSIIQIVRYNIQESIEVNIGQIKRKKHELGMLSIPLVGNLEFELSRMLMNEGEIKAKMKT